MKRVERKFITSGELEERINKNREYQGHVSVRYGNLIRKIRADVDKLRDTNPEREGIIFRELDNKDDFEDTRIQIEMNLKAFQFMASQLSNSSIDREVYEDIIEELGGDRSEVIVIERDELSFFKMLKTVLDIRGYNLRTQVGLAGSQVDGYIEELNLVIEYDERYHNERLQRQRDQLREQELTKELDCHIVRLSWDIPHIENVGIVLLAMDNIENSWD